MSNRRRVQHCSHWGAYTVFLEDDRIVGVEPFGRDMHPSPQIQSITEWANPENRVLAPMVRRSWLENPDKPTGAARGQEPFVQVSWDEAAGLVADEIDLVRSTFGNNSIFAGSYGWTSAGRFHHAASQLKRMLNLVGGYTGHVDTYSIAAGPVILRHVLGSDEACNGRGTTLDTVADHTETLLIFGSLSPRTAQSDAGGVARHLLEGYLERLSQRRVRCILVSPNRTDLPGWVDAEWWPVRPNTDTALMLALAREIVVGGLADNEFLDRHCTGSDEFLSYLEGAQDGIEKNAEWAAAITGISAAAIRGLAPSLVTTRSMLTVSWSLQRALHGEQPYWAALALACVAGQVGKPGGGVGYGYGSVGGVGPPFGRYKAPALPQLKNPTGSFIPVARISDMLLGPGKPFVYEGKDYTYPDIKLVYWAGGNPFHHHQDLRRLDAAWANPRTIIVQEPMWTATAQRADIILPASTSLERCDIAATNRSDHMIAMHRVIEPLGEARSDYEICSMIAERLGVGVEFTEGRDEMGWLRHLYEVTRADAAARLDYHLPDFDTFWAEGNAPLKMEEHKTYLAEYRADPENNRLRTETGKIILHSKMLAGLNYENCRAHPAWIEPKLPQPPSSDRSDRFHLLTPQPEGRLHSQLEKAASSTAFKLNGLERLRISASDALRIGVCDGERVLISNEQGQCLAAAEISNEIAPGTVALPTGSWLAFADDGSGLEMSGNPNVLTVDRPASDFSQGCAAQTCLVHVQPYRRNLPGRLAPYTLDTSYRSERRSPSG